MLSAVNDIRIAPFQGRDAAVNACQLSVLLCQKFIASESYEHYLSMIDVHLGGNRANKINIQWLLCLALQCCNKPFVYTLEDSLPCNFACYNSTGLDVLVILTNLPSKSSSSISRLVHILFAYRTSSKSLVEGFSERANNFTGLHLTLF